jgi:hypothetical protein
MLAFVRSQIDTPIKAVEVGVFHGEFAVFILRVLDPVELHLVDPWKHYDNVGGLMSRRLKKQPWEQTYEEVKQKFAPFPAVKIIRQESVPASEQFQDGSLDFCYIDGDHTYPAVTDDIRVWRPKVRPGGFLAGHDLNIASVACAVFDAFPNNGVEITALEFDISWFVRL